MAAQIGAATIVTLMEIVFCGTPQFAVPTLETLAASGFNVRLVVTPPDRPRGRGMEVASSPVKEAALRSGLEIIQPEKIRHNAEFRARLEQIHPEAIVVVGYGRLIPKWMLDLPPLGNINLHASLLPKYRGAAPIQWAIANGETISGNTTMLLNEGMDTGDILLQQELAIASDDTAQTYGRRLAVAGAELMVNTLRGLIAGSITPLPQDVSQASLAPILKKEDGQINFTRTAKQIYDRLRGFQPWPGGYTRFRGTQVKVLAAAPSSSVTTLSPGELEPSQGKLLVGCGSGTVLEVTELQSEGKKRMSARDFTNGFRLQRRERFGE
jgi:methionyl-tRNA formyltransferase